MNSIKGAHLSLGLACNFTGGGTTLGTSTWSARYSLDHIWGNLLMLGSHWVFELSLKDCNCLNVFLKCVRKATVMLFFFLYVSENIKHNCPPLIQMYCHWTQQAGIHFYLHILMLIIHPSIHPSSFTFPVLLSQNTSPSWLLPQLVGPHKDGPIT